MMTRKLLMQSLKDLMEAAPPKIKIKKLCKKLNAIEGVRGVHDLHVWGIAANKILMTAHFNVLPNSNRSAINAAADVIARDMGISHSTVQLCQLD
jgi:cobalt-zinc-cadmium efflux system protein